MYASHSRQATQYPVPAPPQSRPDGAALPPPSHLHDAGSMMHMPAHQVSHHHQPHHSPQQPQHAHQQPQSAAADMSMVPLPNPAANVHVGTRNGRTYRLDVQQQPIRARMCGFGDKDRRPITPPPCIRLVVCDAKTGKEVDFNDVDSSFFVLMVDLWHEDGSRAVNLVRHSSAAPTVSISSSTTTAYPPVPERPMYMPAPMGYDTYSTAVASRQANPYAQPSMAGGYYTPSPATTAYPQFGTPGAFGQSPVVTMNVQAATANQNHTRNLIGMNAVNACRLNDPDGKTGFWFVLQDLSVRTEGTFRLKLSMCDIGTGQGTNTVVSTGKCPVLASSFSEAFTVYSAKKFPGVIESTPLSKCFAQQGIKIPIRKDGPKTLPNSAEYEGDD